MPRPWSGNYGDDVENGDFTSLGQNESRKIDEISNVDILDFLQNLPTRWQKGRCWNLSKIHKISKVRPIENVKFVICSKIFKSSDQNW